MTSSNGRYSVIEKRKQKIFTFNQIILTFFLNYLSNSFQRAQRHPEELYLWSLFPLFLGGTVKPGQADGVKTRHSPRLACTFQVAFWVRLLA